MTDDKTKTVQLPEFNEFNEFDEYDVTTSIEEIPLDTVVIKEDISVQNENYLSNTMLLLQVLSAITTTETRIQEVQAQLKNEPPHIGERDLYILRLERLRSTLKCLHEAVSILTTG